MQIMDYLIPWSEFEKNSHRYGDEGVPYYVVETSSHANYRPKERYVTDSLKKAKAHGKGSPYADIEKLIDGAVVGRWGRDPKHPEFLWLGGYGGDERESNPFRLSAKDPSDMSAAEINRELDRISAEDSKVNQEFIDAGRGHEKYWDILKKDDPLSRKALALASRRHKLKIEIERRAGPGMSRLPKGFGPRKSNPRAK